MVKKSYTSRDRTTISALYKALVRPILEYGTLYYIYSKTTSHEQIPSFQLMPTTIPKLTKPVPNEMTKQSSQCREERRNAPFPLTHPRAAANYSLVRSETLVTKTR